MTIEIRTMTGWNPKNGDRFKLEEAGPSFSHELRRFFLERWKGHVAVYGDRDLKAEGHPNMEIEGCSGHLFSLVSRADDTETKEIKDWGAQNGDKFRLVGFSQDKGEGASWNTVIKWDFRIGVFQDDRITAEGPRLSVHMDQGYLFVLVSRADAKPETPPHKRWRDMPVEEQLELALHKLHGGAVQYSLTATDPKWKITSFNGPQHDVFYRKKPKPPTKMQILADKVDEALGGIDSEGGGWWAAPGGVEFGASRMAAVRALILSEDET